MFYNFRNGCKSTAALKPWEQLAIILSREEISLIYYQRTAGKHQLQSMISRALSFIKTAMTSSHFKQPRRDRQRLQPTCIRLQREIVFMYLSLSRSHSEPLKPQLCEARCAGLSNPCVTVERPHCRHDVYEFSSARCNIGL